MRGWTLFFAILKLPYPFWYLRSVAGPSLGASPFARLSLALVAAVSFTSGALLMGTGRALNSRFLLCSSSSRFCRSSRWALSFWEMASPGSVNVDRVRAFAEGLGTNGALTIDETRGRLA